MPDPFETLREPVTPLAPRPEFARELRRRIAVELGGGGPAHPLAVREYTPARLHSITPYLATDDPIRAIEWYGDVFGARLLSDPIVMPDGSIGHAELRIGDSVFFLAGEYPAEDHRSPRTLGGSTAAFVVYVPDSDATYARAVDLGATPLRPVTEQYGGRGGVVRDPFGHRWMISTALEAEDVPVEDIDGRRFGDIGYVTFMVPDADRTRRFFVDLFGWDVEASGHIASITPPSGIAGGSDTPEARVYFRVDDIEAVAQRVRDLGGQVLVLNDYPSGGNAECVDDQGMRFDLWRARPGY
jgi:uncharacterized glyoxalase superfamily protein PhnB